MQRLRSDSSSTPGTPCAGDCAAQPRDAHRRGMPCCSLAALLVCVALAFACVASLPGASAAKATIQLTWVYAQLNSVCDSGLCSFVSMSCLCDVSCTVQLSTEGAPVLTGTLPLIPDNYEPDWSFTQSVQVDSYMGKFNLWNTCWDVSAGQSNTFLGSYNLTITNGSTPLDTSVEIDLGASTQVPGFSKFIVRYSVRCADGYYGPTCNVQCQKTTRCRGCDQITGFCTSCSTGFAGPACSECAPNYYPQQTDCVYCVANQNGFYTCNSQGKKICTPGWIGSNCDTFISCPNLSIPNTVKLSCSNTFQSSCVYFCATGYSTSPLSPNAALDTNSTTCLASGSWSLPWLACANINECTLGTHDCNANAVCADTVGSYNCTCNAGFSMSNGGRGASGCVNINECYSNNGNCSHQCIDTPGSFSCACFSGYALNADGRTCTQLDECQLGTHNCHPNATCLDTPGSFSCQCKSGFSGNGTICTNVNECVNSSICPVNSVCYDLLGSYNCVCNTGFIYTSLLTCVPAFSVGFSANSSLIVVEEASATLYISVRILGAATGTVYFNITSSSNAAVQGLDYTLGASLPLLLTFSPAVQEQTIALTILDDSIAEGVEVINYSLNSPVNLTLNPPSSSGTLVINANDAPDGVVQFDAASRSIVLSKIAINSPPLLSIPLRVVRDLASSNQINVTYSYVIRTSLVDGTASVSPRVTLWNFVSSGAGSVLISLALENGAYLAERTVDMRIDSVDTGVLGYYSTAAIQVPATLGAFGTLGFNASSYTAVEGSLVFITVKRTGGLFGSLTATIAASSSALINQATAGADFVFTSTILQFAPGQLSATFNISILDDDIPELQEHFDLQIVQVSGGGTADGSSERATVTILENDDAYGIIGFPQQALATRVSENKTSTTKNAGLSVARYSIPVVRTRGLFGTVSFNVSTVFQSSATPMLNSSVASNPCSQGDVFPILNATFVLGPSETSATITVDIVNDGCPELSEYFTLAITGAVLGAVNASASQSTIQILPNDNPLGLFGLRPTAGVASVRAGRELLLFPASSNLLEVYRTGPALGFAMANVEMFLTPVSNLTSRTPIPSPGYTVTWPSPGRLLLMPVSARALSFGPFFTVNVSTTIPDVRYYTLTFVVYSAIEVGLPILQQEQIPEASTLLINVQPTNSVYGVVEIAPTNASQPFGDRIYIVNETRSTAPSGASVSSSLQAPLSSPSAPAPSSTSVSSGGAIQHLYINVSRTQIPSSSLAITVLFKVIHYTTSPEDVTASEGFVVMPAGQNFVLIDVGIVDDAIPEPDETFAVSLQAIDPSSVSLGFFSTANVTILSNDNAHGTIELDRPESRDFLVVDAKFNTSLTVPILRTQGGAFGDVTVVFNITAVTNITLLQAFSSRATPAVAGRDFSVNVSSLVIRDSFVSSSDLTVTIPRSAAAGTPCMFRIELVSVEPSDARLGQFTSINVVVTNSDTDGSGASPSSASPSLGLIAGVAVCLLALAAGAACLFIWRRKRAQKQSALKSLYSQDEFVGMELSEMTSSSIEALSQPTSSGAGRHRERDDLNHHASAGNSSKSQRSGSEYSMHYAHNVAKNPAASTKDYAYSKTAGKAAAKMPGAEEKIYVSKYTEKVYVPIHDLAELLVHVPGETCVDDGVPDELSLPPIMPRAFKLSDLVLGQKLGSGQFGVVSAARIQGRGETLFAVKFLKEDADAKSRADFLKEVDMISRFRNPYIVQVIGACTTAEPCFLVLELLPYGDLKSVLRKCVKSNVALTVPELLHILIQVAFGMDYLASINFVHRDLAARNCLVGHRGVVKISDFGMSRELSLAQDYYRIQSKGKLPLKWLAPESIMYKKFSTRSDVWSFGVLCMETFTYGAPPYPDVDVRDMHDYLQSGARMEKPQTCSDAIYALMLDCWMWNPLHRPAFTVLCERLKELEHETNPSRQSPRDFGLLSSSS